MPKQVLHIGIDDTDSYDRVHVKIRHRYRFKDMEDDGVKRDSFTFSSAISTCGAAGRWEEAVSLINDMNSSSI